MGTTAHPTASLVLQAMKNLMMDLDDAGCQARYLIRDRDGKFPARMEEILAGAGIQTVLTGIRMPRMNAVRSGGCNRVAVSFSIAACCGSNATCGTPCASTNGSTTGTEPIKPWPRRPRCVPSRIRSSIQSESPA
ncbi:hypothetical protein [Nonomuraea sp. NPDC049625]|uniref:hypothetical protein n=1 Tax=Nonomuraea sp. NPDC049625 TaxID=3155775 RepID=UPI00341B2675